MRLLRTTFLVAVVCAVAPSAAGAHPCSDRNPVIVRGTQWIVYTGDSRQERRNLSCRKARRIARRMIARGIETPGWRCNSRRRRCVRGGTYIDRFGNRQWRYLVGWHRAE